MSIIGGSLGREAGEGEVIVYGLYNARSVLWNCLGDLSARLTWAR